MFSLTSNVMHVPYDYDCRFCSFFYDDDWCWMYIYFRSTHHWDDHSTFDWVWTIDWQCYLKFYYLTVEYYHVLLWIWMDFFLVSAVFWMVSLELSWIDYFWTIWNFVCYVVLFSDELLKINVFVLHFFHWLVWLLRGK